MFLPGEFHGQRNVLGYSPWGPKESDMTELLILNRDAIPGDLLGNSLEDIWTKIYKCQRRLFGYIVLCLVAQSRLALCDPVDCSSPGSSVLLEWIVMPSSRWSSQPRDQTQVFRIAGRFFTSWATMQCVPDKEAAKVQIPWRSLPAFSKKQPGTSMYLWKWGRQIIYWIRV